MSGTAEKSWSSPDDPEFQKKFKAFVLQRVMERQEAQPNPKTDPVGVPPSEEPISLPPVNVPPSEKPPFIPPVGFVVCGFIFTSGPQFSTPGIKLQLDGCYLQGERQGNENMVLWFSPVLARNLEFVKGKSQLRQ
ncbi:hypothetical protein FCULG_00007633 [Fusarium culmorum]|uniref:Uncharacterized protein n=1 Tax=Fusarium culmorum TaxID=5516 RepID=A0A2T4H0W3_FUSCU|nr:hypothetical protein FCULG_00007633 [Fusarium culmorum]